MNESRAARYHRRKRGAACVQVAVLAALLGGLLVSGGSVRLREVSGGVPAAYALLLALCLELAVLPVAWYRTFAVERQYGLVRASAGHWLRDHARAVALTILSAIVAAECLYLMVRIWPAWWWVAAAVAGVLLAAVVMWLAPVVILPIVRPSRPIVRDGLSQRVAAIARRIGIPAPALHEWRSAHDTRAHASVVGVGRTRRILLSSTLLADYSDDEIEAIVAHEIGHQVHRDTVRMLGAQLVVFLAGLYLAWAALALAWQPLGLMSPADPAGLPLLLLVAGGTRLAAIPLLNGMSRRSERRADRFALQVTASPGGFISAVRRMAAHNLVEERPSRTAYGLFHTHPTPEERMSTASLAGGARRGDRQTQRAADG